MTDYYKMPAGFSITYSGMKMGANAIDEVGMDQIFQLRQEREQEGKAKYYNAFAWLGGGFVTSLLCHNVIPLIASVVPVYLSYRAERRAAADAFQLDQAYVLGTRNPNNAMFSGTLAELARNNFMKGDQVSFVQEGVFATAPA